MTGVSATELGYDLINNPVEDGDTICHAGDPQRELEQRCGGTELAH